MSDIFERELPEIEAEENGETFQINSDSAAEWLLRRLGNLEAEKARVQAHAAEIVKQLDSDAQRLRFLYEGELQEFCRRKLEQTGSRRKSVTFFQGSVAFRTVSASIRVADQQAAIAYAKQHPFGELVIKEALDVAEYRRYAQQFLTEDGELIPGIETTPERESFSIRFGNKD